jgi:zinc transport system permease protein
MFEIFNYSFMVRAFIAGGAIAIIAPMIGTFLVMRRFSLFADSLSHVALAGVAIGIISGIYPVATAVVACVIAAILIETNKKQLSIKTNKSKQNNNR